MPWRRKWQPTLVFLPGESHGLRSLVGYSPQGSKELDRTERLHFHFHGMMILPFSSWCPALHMCLLLSPIPHEELQAALLIPSFSPVPMATPSINAEMWLQGWVVFCFFFSGSFLKWTVDAAVFAHPSTCAEFTAGTYQPESNQVL